MGDGIGVLLLILYSVVRLPARVLVIFSNTLVKKKKDVLWVLVLRDGYSGYQQYVSLCSKFPKTKS